MGLILQLIQVEQVFGDALKRYGSIRYCIKALIDATLMKRRLLI